MKKTCKDEKRSPLHRRAAGRCRNMAAVCLARTAAGFSRLAGHQGSSLPGKAASVVSPSVLADLAGQVRRSVFAVCGTNGKTTVNNILCRMLEAEGSRVVCNRVGANMPAGITGAFTAAASWTGRLDADFACLEVDEASARLVFGAVRPDCLILTNLFRDQLDRYGEIDTTMELLKEAITQVPEMTLIVNADDPLTVSLAAEAGNPAVYYGIRDVVTGSGSGGGGATGPGPGGGPGGEVREGRFCRRCGAPLVYSRIYYGQMGVWHCPGCGFRRPEPRYQASGICTEGGISFSVLEAAAVGKADAAGQVTSGLRGLYNVYNLLAVWSALREDGHSCAASFSAVMREYRPPFGRNEAFRIGQTEVILNLAKNPAGFNQNIDAMLEDRDPKRLVIAINDNDQDGRDVSWLWDVAFEKVRDTTVQSVTVSGIRALDMRLRLRYEDISAEIAETPEQALERLLAEGHDRIYALVNYTALFPVHRFLQQAESRDRQGKMSENRRK